MWYIECSRSGASSDAGFIRDETIIGKKLSAKEALVFIGVISQHVKLDVELKRPGNRQITLNKKL